MTFELVVVNLYPFEQTIAREGVTIPEAIEQIDIGGPSMVRSSAKNHAFVTLATDPEQYDEILAEFKANGAQLWKRVDSWPARPSRGPLLTTPQLPAISRRLTRRMMLGITRIVWSYLSRRLDTLRYGENPHQSAALYALPNAGRHSLVNAEQLNGKELSYNNLLDLDAALAIARSLPQPGVAVLKHNNPCGAATASTLGEAVAKAWEGDPLSAVRFGDRRECFGRCRNGRVILPSQAALWKRSWRPILTSTPSKSSQPSPNGGLMCDSYGPASFSPARVGQSTGRSTEACSPKRPTISTDDTSAWQVVTTKKPSPALQADLEFAWAVCRHVKSNAIVIAKEQALVGVGAGQMSRVDAVEIAIRKGGDRTAGCVLGLRRLLSVRRFHPTSRRGGNRRDHSTGGLETRWRSDRGLQCPRAADDLYGHAALSTLRE